MTITVKPVFEPGWITHRIVIERPTATAHGSGVIVTFSPFAIVWAAVELVPIAKMVDAACQGAPLITHRITIRWRDDVTAGMRIRHRGRMFAIETVADPDERRRFLLIEAREET